MIRFEQKNTDKYAVLFLDQLKERNGGPSTYLYHLKQGLRAQKIKNFVFYAEIRVSRVILKISEVNWMKSCL